MHTQLPQEHIMAKILVIRGQKVLLDKDLAHLYWIETKVLKQAVRRNIARFPDDFMLTLSEEEYRNWRSQFVTSNSGDAKWLRYKPFAFTEHWVLMLANVLKSQRALEISLQIIRVFVAMRHMLATQQWLEQKMQEIEQRLGEHDEKMLELWFELKKLTDTPEPTNTRKIWFVVE